MAGAFTRSAGTPTTDAHGGALRVLYAYAGKKRKSDIGAFLTKFGYVQKVRVELTELDTLRDPRRHDLRRMDRRRDLLGKVANGKYDVVITSPPCNTFTRVVWANKFAPRPV